MRRPLPYPLRRPLPGPLPILTALGLATATPAGAGAAEQEEWQAGVQAGFASARADGRRPPGAFAGLALQYGLTDAWAARGDVGMSFHPVSEEGGRPEGTVRVGTASAGVTYILDVVRVVPSVELSAGLADVSGAVREPQRALAATLGGGLDYLLDRRWSIGTFTRYQRFLVKLSGPALDEGGDPSVLVVGLRLERRFLVF